MTDVVCSSRACNLPAEFALLWNNPKIHQPDRRKVWLACPEHRQHLSSFLSQRGFLIEEVPATEIPDGAG